VGRHPMPYYKDPKEFTVAEAVHNQNVDQQSLLPLLPTPEDHHAQAELVDVVLLSRGEKICGLLEQTGSSYNNQRSLNWFIRSKSGLINSG